MNNSRVFYIAFLTLLTFFKVNNVNAQVYQLSDQVFIDYLKAANADLVNDADELLIDQVGIANLQSVLLPNASLTNVDGIQFISTLKEIDVSNNQINAIPDLSQLIGLTELNASNNNLTEFNSVTSLRSIETLNVNNNQITIFPYFYDDVELKHLSINNNNITEITTFSKAMNLLFLDISYNRITDLQLFGALNFPVLETLNVGDNYLYFDDYENFPEDVTINKERQRIVELSTPDTLYIGDTLKIDLSHDTHVSNFSVFIERSTLFELEDSYTTELNWVISDTSQSGTYFVELNNTTFRSHWHNTIDFTILVLEEKEIDPEVDPDPEVESEKEEYQSVLIPGGTKEESTIYIDGINEAVVYDKSGEVYTQFPLPYEWDGSNSSGIIVPGYYVIKQDADNYIKITIVY